MGKDKKDGAPEAKTKGIKKSKFFKLGEKANSFYDPGTDKKVYPNDKVEFNALQMSTEKFRAAKRGGHLVECTEADLNEPEDLITYRSLTTREERLKFIKDTYAVDNEEALDTMSDEQLLAEVKEYEGIDE